jgi:hypothetical protein
MRQQQLLHTGRIANVVDVRSAMTVAAPEASAEASSWRTCRAFEYSTPAGNLTTLASARPPAAGELAL